MPDKRYLEFMNGFDAFIGDVLFTKKELDRVYEICGVWTTLDSKISSNALGELSLREILNDYKNNASRFFEYANSLKRQGFTWIEGQPKNLEMYSLFRRWALPTLKLIGQSKDWENKEALKYALTNLFCRLSSYPHDSFVPVIDLIKTIEIPYVDMKQTELRDAIEGLLFTLVSRNVPLPNEFIPELGVILKK